MNKLKLVLADRDESYVKSFGNYISVTANRHQFDVKLFTSEETLRKYLEKQPKVDILLAAENFSNSHFPENDKCLLLSLFENRAEAEKREGVFKYQPLNELFSSVLRIYYETFSGAGSTLNKTSDTEVISVYSPSGGSGKTSLAVMLSRQLSQQDKKIFYLNLELFNSASLYFQTAEDRPSLQVFYYLKARREQLLAKIEKLKKHDPYMQVDYFDVLPSPDEMLEVSQGDVQTLLQTLVDTGEYDYIIADLDSSLHDLTLGGLKAANQVVWVLNNDIQSFYKSQVLLENCEDFFEEKNVLYDKSTFVLNRFLGYLAEEYASYNFPIKAYLPFEQDWVQMTDREKIFYQPVMAKEMNALAQDMMKSSQAGVANG